MEKLTEIENTVIQKIEGALLNEQLISDPDLNLYDFAKAINTSARTVSNTINRHFQRGFKALLNPYRVNKAVRLIKSGQTKGLIEVGKASGFKSRTTFFTSFKQETGVCPREFAKLVESGNPI